ncbi:hypothetical protein M011DRAFT_297146 [Sporormia fimetaria CBS 119925]|uniref:Uncharacterized protein n=1 Tax=Sporormia fimetaria CBS 119925 TaxID=1340428 RepID=A0A6A6UY80_9PLEO|nr:hypothetical protein M011DRAFT_297146 [Sporormia fimetaria CBS 119925]
MTCSSKFSFVSTFVVFVFIVGRYSGQVKMLCMLDDISGILSPVGILLGSVSMIYTFKCSLRLPSSLCSCFRASSLFEA